MHESEQPSVGEPVEVIGSGAAIVQIAGKVRGRRARRLGDQLEDLAAAGVRRVVLDLRELSSIDSLGSISLERGVDAGLRMHLVVGPAFEADRCLNLRGLARRSVKVHSELEQALACVRQIVDSGFQLA